MPAPDSEAAFMRAAERVDCKPPDGIEGPTARTCVAGEADVRPLE